MKKVFLLTLIAVFAASSMAFAWSPFAKNSETVGKGELESGTNAKVNVNADLTKDSERAKVMLKEVGKDGKGESYTGSTSSKK